MQQKNHNALEYYPQRQSPNLSAGGLAVSVQARCLISLRGGALGAALHVISDKH